MEPKKNPKVEVHRKRSLIFNFSLVLSLLVVITAFRWSSPIPPDIVCPQLIDSLEGFDYVAITNFNEVPEPPKPEVKITPPKAIIPVFVVSNNPDPVPIPVDPSTPISEPGISIIEVPELPDTTTVDFFKVESPPEPVGGYKGFYKMLGENLKYPESALRKGIEGKVFVQFTVDKNGDVISLKVLRGISKECDAESMRVMSLTKWTPGKQRGRPVKTKMILPVNFKLQTED
jgi:periplasmic protein TonB